MKARAAWMAVAGVVGLVVACGAENATMQVAAPAAVPNAADVTDASTAPSAAPMEAGVAERASDGGKLCGCGLCEPRMSEDSCTKDEDCAPAKPCHAHWCVAKAKAEPRTPGTMCTQILMCGTADANACGCVQGKCALHGR